MRFTIRAFNFLAVIFIFPALLLSGALLVAADMAKASPVGDTYTVSGINLVNNYTSNVTLNGATKVLAPQTNISERYANFSGFPGGLPFLDAVFHVTVPIRSWSSAGLIAEFKVTNSNGGLLASSPFGRSVIEISNLDLDFDVPATYRVLGFYLDFRSNGQQLQYSLDPDTIEEAGDAIGTGPHPLDPGRTVLYPSVETEGLPLLETVFAVGNRVRFNMDTQVMFGPGASLGAVLSYAFGVDPLSPPVNELRIGLYIGLGADFNGDGMVDGGDFVIWQRGMGITSGATRAKGDANGDGAVNGADLTIWRQDYGKHL